MAFLKKAYAAVTHPNWGPQNWVRFVEEHRTQMVGRGPFRTASGSPNLVAQASEILKQEFDPKNFLLTHATIVASVDTDEVPNVRLGTVNELGRHVNRKWANFRVRPACDIYINNNHDCWDRPVLLKSYRTFVGAHNFCFAPGTRVMMADGAYRPIEQICVGDEVVTHEGRARRVTHVFERDFEGDLRAVRFDRFKDPILVTGNHPFRSAETSVPPTRMRPGTSASNALRYRRDQIAKALRGEKNVYGDEFRAEKGWRNAADLEAGAFVLGPCRVEGTCRNLSEATLLGYYAAEGCPMGAKSGSDGFVLSFGPHEKHVAEDARRHALHVWPDARVEVRPSQTSLRVEVFAAGAREWCLRMGGHLAHGKKLDSSVFEWDRESLLRLLGAWMTGDGNLHKGTLRLRGTSVSRELADQMCRVAEVAGVKSSVVFESRRIGEVMSTVRMIVGGETRSFDVIPRHHAWTVLVSKGSVEEIATRSARWPNLRVAQSRKRQEIAWWEGCRLHRVASNEPFAYEGKVYNIEVEEDHSYVVEHGIAVHNCEHVQIEEQSKGRIIDAAARDIGDSVYVDILIATDRRHASLIRDVESGRMSTLSMGCSVTETQCTKCGNVAADETEMCEHVRYAKGNYEFDAQGRKYRVAELCGHDSLDPTGGVTFIEASWVAVPAFQGAVMRNILEPDQINAGTRDRARAILASPPPEWTQHQEGLQKAARFASPVAPPVDVSDDEILSRVAQFPPMPGAAPGGAPEGGEPEEKDPLDELEEKLEKSILDRVKKRIEKKLRKDEDDEDDAEGSSAELATSTNENINHQAALRRRAALISGAEALVRIARSDVELLDGLARLNQSHGVQVSRDLYRAVLRVGSTDGQPSLEKYLQRCVEVLGRKPTTGEAKTMVRLGRILSLRKKTRF